MNRPQANSYLQFDGGKPAKTGVQMRPVLKLIHGVNASPPHGDRITGLVAGDPYLVATFVNRKVAKKFRAEIGRLGVASYLMTWMGRHRLFVPMETRHEVHAMLGKFLVENPDVRPKRQSAASMALLFTWAISFGATFFLIWLAILRLGGHI